MAKTKKKPESLWHLCEDGSWTHLEKCHLSDYGGCDSPDCLDFEHAKKALVEHLTETLSLRRLDVQLYRQAVSNAKRLTQKKLKERRF